MKQIKVKDGVARCPHCGGTQITQGGRTMKGLLAFGVFARKRMECVACGKRLKRR